MPYEQLDLVASLIEEADFTASLAEDAASGGAPREAREVRPPGQDIVEQRSDKLDASLREILPDYGVATRRCRPGMSPSRGRRTCARGRWRWAECRSGERGAILALLGSVERAEILIHRIDAERKSVNRQADPRARGTKDGSRSAYQRRPLEPGAGGIILGYRADGEPV